MVSIKSFITYLVFGWLFLTGALAAIVYEGGTVIAYDDSTDNVKILYNTSIVIEGNEITQILAKNDSTSFPTNANRIDASGKIISPGFIDV
jgi:imidazolonepropionase-like amidohydrolase